MKGLLSMAYVKNFTEPYNIRGDKFNVTAPQEFFNDGRRKFNEKLDDQAVNRARDQYRAHHGMLTPNDIKSLDQDFKGKGLSLAKEAGIPSRRLKFYETGMIASDRDDKALKRLSISLF